MIRDSGEGNVTDMHEHNGDLKERCSNGGTRFDLISDALPFGRLWYTGLDMQSDTHSFTVDHMML